MASYDDSQSSVTDLYKIVKKNDEMDYYNASNEAVSDQNVYITVGSDDYN